MIPHGVEIFVGIEPIDLRWGFDRLAGVVTERVRRDARSGALFLFFGRRRDALKILFFDGSGLCLFYKRLDSGTFRIPRPTGSGQEASIEIDERALDDILDAIEVDKTPVPKQRRRRSKRTVH
jgi:transposase